MIKSALLIFFNFFSVYVFSQNVYWQQQVNIKISVALDDQQHTLTGFETIEYTNNSPDTLFYIWMHVWPNAYKNDRTAYSDQLLQNGSTNFYFSDAEKKGYINKLNFKANGLVATIIDHPQHQDIIKIILPSPLLAGKTCIIETPFFVKIPYNFSKGGHINQSYQITQWYPKPAVYDAAGWQVMPYLNQAGFYNNFGNYEVSIKVPANYVVAASGKQISQTIEPEPVVPGNNMGKTQPIRPIKKPFLFFKLPMQKTEIATAANFKTITFKQNNCTDFAWFANKNFIIQQDTLLLPSGKMIDVKMYTIKDAQNKSNPLWQNAIRRIKQAILFKSIKIGEYPYQNISIVQGDNNESSSIEYPTISCINGAATQAAMDIIIEVSIGKNWVKAILASNERTNAWMVEGINRYYNKQYFAANKIQISTTYKSNFLQKRIPNNWLAFALENRISANNDQPINTASQSFNVINYNLIAYEKASNWMLLLAQTVGVRLFDSCVQQYYKQYAFKHPTPLQFKQVVEGVSGKDVTSIFNLLHTKGALPTTKKIIKPTIKITSFFNFNNTNNYKYVYVAPAIGYNKYDNIMLGAAVHNYTLPANKLQFFIAPTYATASQQLNVLGTSSYTFFTKNKKQLIELSIAATHFTGGIFTDSVNTKNYLTVTKIVPAVKVTFNGNNPLSTLHTYIQWKTFFIAEKNIQFTRDTFLNRDNIAYPIVNRYINQLKFVVENSRVLYPYKAVLQAEQADGFIRLAFTSNYFFNYANGGGMQMRFFAGKFIYTTPKTIFKKFAYDAFLLNMSGAKGFEDYTYSNYFVGRNDFDGFASQQIMEKDGFFKVRTDLLGDKIGKTDDWLAAVNFTTDFPKAINPLQVLPIKIPLKIFVDIGTYAEAWNKVAPTGKFIYDAGLQISLFKNIVQIYVPILYSKVYADYFKSTITEKRFVKNISFSIDVQNISLKKLFPQFAF